MNSKRIIIGSRGSDLALWQANFIKAELERWGQEVVIEIIKTQGDLIQHLSFDKMEGKGFFTKELENALHDGRIDLAVHSFKDLETSQPEGLSIAAISHRANPADILLIKPDFVDENQPWHLGNGIKLGTSSARRKMQIRYRRPDVEIDDIRGNVPTRIEKLRSGNFDAIILAKAGLDRLGLDVSDLHLYEFDPTDFIPAPAQGALACQIRSSDANLAEVLSAIHNKDVAELVMVERKVLNLFHGGCQLPLGAYCIKKEGKYHLRAIMAPAHDQMPVTINLVADRPDGFAEEAVDQLKKKRVAL